jgi:5-methylcytosine-specific restriction endonuclease McrA
MRTFTWKQKAEILVQQARCRSCGERLVTLKNTDFHHVHEYALGGKTEVANAQALCKECHSFETNGTKATSYGSSKHEVAKLKRLAKAAPDLDRALTKPCGHKPTSVSRFPKGRKMPSRPFERRARP